MSFYKILEVAGFPTSSKAPAVFAAAVAAACQDIDEQNLHCLVAPDDETYVACVCGRTIWNPSGDVSLVADKLAQGWRWRPISEERKAAMAQQMVVNALNAHWRMVNADTMSEALGS